MGLFKKFKSLLGIGDGRDVSPDSAGTTVTVEREPSAESEHAVKGTDEFEDESEAEAEKSEPDEKADDGTGSLEEIDGIGPTYAERLESAGIATVADLAAADLSTVADASDAGESRAEDWIEQAKNER